MTHTHTHTHTHTQTNNFIYIDTKYPDSPIYIRNALYYLCMYVHVIHKVISVTK